uniref:Uncharacterized protein n=1 Tax=Anguilla anguilla TaxID=7936 RepID=A0A0E9TE22_ANGAN
MVLKGIRFVQKIGTFNQVLCNISQFSDILFFNFLSYKYNIFSFFCGTQNPHKNV